MKKAAPSDSAKRAARTSQARRSPPRAGDAPARAVARPPVSSGPQTARQTAASGTTPDPGNAQAVNLQPRDWSLQRNIAFHMASVIFRMDQDLRDTVLRELDLTYAHFRVLQVLYEADGQQIGDIARAIVVRQPVLSRVITQMQERELVERRPDADDSRIMRVYLTEHGRSSYEQAWPPAHAIMESAFSVLEPDERALLEDFMRRVDHHVNH